MFGIRRCCDVLELCIRLHRRLHWSGTALQVPILGTGQAIDHSVLPGALVPLLGVLWF